MNTRLHTAGLVLTLLLFSASSRAAWQGSASATYAVKATVDSFVGKAASEPIAIAEGADEVTVTFAIAKMDTGKKKRDVEMQHMFHADQHPDIVGVARTEALLALTADGEVPVRLTINGQTREIPARISKLVREEGKLAFVADLDLSLKAFGLKPPSIMKIIKVADLVKATAAFTLTADPAPASQP